MISDLLRALYNAHGDMNREIIAWHLPYWMAERLKAELMPDGKDSAAFVTLSEEEKEKLPDDMYLGIPIKYVVDWQFAVISKDRSRQ